MTRQSLDALRRTITIAWPTANENDARQFLVQTARKDNEKIIAEQRGRMGISPTVTAFANTPSNHNLDSVKLPGPIVHLYDYRTEIVEFALGALIKASPVQSGAYAGNHTVFLNGVPVDRLDRLEDGDEVMIANPVPYARRLEIGKTKSGRDFVLQVPNRIYETVAKKVLRPKYRNLVNIEFGYVTLPEALSVKGKLSSHYGTGGSAGPRGGGLMRKRNQKVGSKVQSPAIFITALR